MNDLNHSKTRTRAFTQPEVLQAIAHTLKRPGAHLVSPSRISPLHPGVAAAPAAELTLDDPTVAGIAGWARVMVPAPTSVIVTWMASLSVQLKVTGQLAENGPAVIVIAWLENWPLDLPGESHAITVDELYTVAECAAAVSEPVERRSGVLAGAL